MRKVIAGLLLLLCCSGVNGQKVLGRNAVGINIPGLFIRNMNIYYEKSLFANVSITLHYGYISNGAVPFIQLLSLPSAVSVNSARTASHIFMPSVKVYLHKIAGLYVSPYVRYSVNDVSTDINYSYSLLGLLPVSVSRNFQGSITTKSAGVYLGYRRRIVGNLGMDCWIAGADYGTCSGSLQSQFAAIPIVAAVERVAFQTALNSLNTAPYIVKSSIMNDGTAAQISVKGPWIGIRVGICASLSF